MGVGAVESDQHISEGDNLLSDGQCFKQRPMDNSKDPLPSRPINIRPSNNSTSHGVESLCGAGGRHTDTLTNLLGDKDRYAKDDSCQEVGAAEVDVGMGNGIVAVEEKNEDRGNKGKNREEMGPQLIQNFELKGE